MLRKKFGGPRASAAKQVVTLKPASSSGAAAAEETSSTVAPSIETAAAPSTNTLLSPQKMVKGRLGKDISHDLQPTTSTHRTESHKEIPSSTGNDAVADEIMPANEVQMEDETFIVPATPIPSTRVRTFSQTSIYSTISTVSAIKRKKRAFEKDEELDAAKFTMADLIDWRPKTENTLRSKWKDAEKKFKEEGFAMKKEKKEEETETEIGPKVKMDEDGNVIIDEESLVVRRNPENSVFETVDDDLMPKKLNSLSFKRNYQRTTTWSELETELFYDILASTGTDFSLMQEYLPFKTRADIKKKFNKEERVNLLRINSTLSKPSILNDEIIKGRIEKYMDLIDRQKEEKLNAKLSKKKKNKVTENAASSDAEIIEEEVIQEKSDSTNSDQPEASDPKKSKTKKVRKPKDKKKTPPKKTSKKKAKKELTPVATTSEESVVAPSGPVTPPTVLTRSAARRENENATAAAMSSRPRNSRFGGLFEELGSDFPYFDIEEDDNLQAPNLKKMPGDLFFLRIPTTTQLKVMPKTKKSNYHRIGIITPNNTKYFVGVSTENSLNTLMLHKL